MAQKTLTKGELDWHDKFNDNANDIENRISKFEKTNYTDNINRFCRKIGFGNDGYQNALYNAFDIVIPKVSHCFEIEMNIIGNWNWSNIRGVRNVRLYSAATNPVDHISSSETLFISNCMVGIFQMNQFEYDEKTETYRAKCYYLGKKSNYVELHMVIRGIYSNCDIVTISAPYLADLTDVAADKEVFIRSKKANPHEDDTYDLGVSSLRWKDIYATNGTIQTSDAREKENIETLRLDKSLAFMKALNPVQFNFVGRQRPHYGLISQEVEQVITDLGIDFGGFIKTPVENKVLDDDGNEISSEVVDYKYGLRYEEFISLLIKVVQNQQSRIEALEEKLEWL